MPSRTRVKNAAHSDIKGVFFDYGGVIEDLAPKEDSRLKGIEIVRGLLAGKGIAIEARALREMVESGQREYERWYARNGFRELPNGEIWSSHLLKKVCVDKSAKTIVESMGEELSSIYEFHLFRRRVARDLREVMMTLFFSGYTVALVSNTMSSTLIPERLRKFGVDRVFTALVLSVDAGFRKPNPEIFRAALERTGLVPGRCVYVGDTLSRDVEGSKRAGFRVSVLKKSGLTEEKDRGYRGDAVPDLRISSLSELLPILS